MGLRNRQYQDHCPQNEKLALTLHKPLSQGSQVRETQIDPGIALRLPHALAEQPVQPEIVQRRELATSPLALACSSAHTRNPVPVPQPKQIIIS